MSAGIQEENTPEPEFYGIAKRRALPEGHRDSGKGLGMPGHSLGNAAPAQLHQGILSHPPGAGAELSEKSWI